jgi:Alginate export
MKFRYTDNRSFLTLIAVVSTIGVAFADGPTELDASTVALDVSTVAADQLSNPEGGTEAPQGVIAEAPSTFEVDQVPYQPMDQPVAMAPEAKAVPCGLSKEQIKKKKEAATENMKKAYAPVFYNNNFNYLNDPYYDGPSFLGDSLKGLADNKLDLGGEVRVRYHDERNMRGRVPGLRGTGPSGLGVTANDDNFFLTRTRLYSNYKINDTFRIFGEYLYADSAGETFASRPIEENRGEIQNLFLDTALTESLTMRLGRQELLFGDQRLVSPLDWANTRRSFQGASGIYKGENWDVTGFFTHPLNRIPANESKIDDADEDQDFYGVYSTRKGLDIGVVDLYYLGYDNQLSDFSFHTLGSRVAGETEGNILYETESGFQFGENSPGFGNHSAVYFTQGLGRVLNFGDWKPTLWFWYDYASGGDTFPGAEGDDSFHHLFPLAHKYNGFMDLFGRRNLHDINSVFTTPFASKNVKLLLWYHYFLLDEKTTPYDVVMQPFNTNTVAGDRELGHEIDVLFDIAVNPRNNVQIGYSHFTAGDYYATTPGVVNNDADFFYAQYQTRF